MQSKAPIFGALLLKDYSIEVPPSSKPLSELPPEGGLPPPEGVSTPSGDTLSSAPTSAALPAPRNESV